MTHTPGPWTVKPSKAKTQVTKIAENGSYDFICDTLSGPFYLEECQANARLIASAPDLLEACEAMQKALYEHHLLDVKKHFSLCVADAAMGTAIARAKGA